MGIVTPHGSGVLGSTLSSGYCQCGVCLHLLPVPIWGSSVFSILFPPLKKKKKMPVRWIGYWKLSLGGNVWVRPSVMDWHLVPGSVPGSTAALTRIKQLLKMRESTSNQKALLVQFDS